MKDRLHGMDLPVLRQISPIQFTQFGLFLQCCLVHLVFSVALVFCGTSESESITITSSSSSPVSSRGFFTFLSSIASRLRVEDGPGPQQSHAPKQTPHLSSSPMSAASDIGSPTHFHGHFFLSCDLSRPDGRETLESRTPGAETFVLWLPLGPLGDHGGKGSRWCSPQEERLVM